MLLGALSEKKRGVDKCPVIRSNKQQLSQFSLNMCSVCDHHLATVITLR